MYIYVYTFLLLCICIIIVDAVPIEHAYMSIFYCTLCLTECHSFNTGMVGMVSFQMNFQQTIGL